LDLFSPQVVGVNPDQRMGVRRLGARLLGVRDLQNKGGRERRGGKKTRRRVVSRTRSHDHRLGKTRGNFYPTKKEKRSLNEEHAMQD